MFLMLVFKIRYRKYTNKFRITIKCSIILQSIKNMNSSFYEYSQFNFTDFMTHLKFIESLHIWPILIMSFLTSSECCSPLGSTIFFFSARNF